MTEVVVSIRRVTDITGEISAATGHVLEEREQILLKARLAALDLRAHPGLKLHPVLSVESANEDLSDPVRG